MMNNYAINPAVAGMKDYYQIRTTIRNQWVGIEDAPTTNILSVYGKRGNNVGLGGIVFNDQVGPTSRIGANMSYTYHFSLSKKIHTQHSEPKNDVVVYINCYRLNNNNFQMLTQLSEILEEQGEIGEFELDEFTVNVKDLDTYEKTLIICKTK